MITKDLTQHKMSDKLQLYRCVAEIRLILMHPTMDSIIPYILSMIHLALLTSFSMLHAVYLTKVVCCVSRV